MRARVYDYEHTPGDEGRIFVENITKLCVDAGTRRVHITVTEQSGTRSSWTNITHSKPRPCNMHACKSEEVDLETLSLDATRAVERFVGQGEAKKPASMRAPRRQQEAKKVLTAADRCLDAVLWALSRTSDELLLSEIVELAAGYLREFEKESTDVTARSVVEHALSRGYLEAGEVSLTVSGETRARRAKLPRDVRAALSSDGDIDD